MSARSLPTAGTDGRATPENTEPAAAAETRNSRRENEPAGNMEFAPTPLSDHATRLSGCPPADGCPLPHQLQAELDLARGVRLAVDLSEQHITEGPVRPAELRRVERVEQLRPKLEPDLFLDSKSPMHRE